ncbi:MAG: hypothetical protein HQ541_16815 [Mariniphaga sp.]|nr:hypothetical protein [Mariniphaga sp.]
MIIAGFLGPQEIIIILLIVLIIPILLIVLLVRNTNVSCPKCGKLTIQGKFRFWQFLVSILFFPFGLLSLLAGRAPTTCSSCEYRWQS